MQINAGSVSARRALRSSDPSWWRDVAAPSPGQRATSASRRVNQPRQHFPAAVDPTAKPLRCARPVPLIDPSPQRRSLTPPRAEVEGEVDYGGEPLLWLSGQHRAVAQRCRECRLQIARQIDLCFALGDRRVLRLAKMAIADSPVAGWADVWVSRPGSSFGTRWNPPNRFASTMAAWGIWLMIEPDRIRAR